MVLTNDQIQGQIKERKKANLQELQEAKIHEGKIRLHSEVTVSRSRTDSALTEVLNMAEMILPEDTFIMFLNILRFPIPTIDLTSRIYKALEKIFDGRNPVFKYRFNSPEDSQDWEVYRNNVLNHLNFWRSEGFETMKTAINSIMIVDLPSVQVTDRPEPKPFFLSLNNVVDFELKSDGVSFEWIAFKQGKGKIAVFCDQYFRVYKTKNGSFYEIESTPEIENVHDLGFTPARFFWTSPINTRTKVVKKSPLSAHIGKLDMYFFFDVSNDHLNIYGRYPIYSVFSSDCDFEDGQTGSYCHKGFIRNREGNYVIGSRNKLQSCPMCAKKRLNGAGSVIEIDPPSIENNNVDLRNPVQITSIDVPSLEYNSNDLEKRSDKIYNSVTGFQGLSLNNKAVNEKQVIAVFESLESALKEPQQNFEQAIEWADKTICLLRYGSESFESVSISLGTEHYILTPSQIISMYNDAKEFASSATLDLIQDKYFETEFRNNPEQLQRQIILKNLEPFRHLSNEEVTKMFSDNQVSFEHYMLKKNFSSLIMRFERENISINQFGLNLDFDKKIEVIQGVLNTYVQEMKPEPSIM